MSNRSGLSILLPTYNERENIVPLCQEILSTIRESQVVDQLEIIVVDDNSPDGTYQAIADLAKREPAIRPFLRTTERGLGSAFGFAVAKAESPLLFFMDTDFSHPPRYIVPLVKKIIEGSAKNVEAVFATRYSGDGEMAVGLSKLPQKLLSILCNKYLSFILGTKLSDASTGFFVIRRETLLEYPLPQIFTGYGDFALRLIYALTKDKKKVEEIPFIYEERRFGESKTRLLKVSLLYLWVSIKLRLGFVKVKY